MPMSDKDRELLEKIENRISNSSVLNGGFDKLVIVVDHLKEKQDQIGDAVRDISSLLYNPENGLFSRVQSIETKTDSLKEDLDRHSKTDKEMFTHFNEELKTEFKKLDEITTIAAEAKDTTKRLKRAAGEDLQDLNNTIQLNKKMSKLYWGLLATLLAGIGNLLWQLFKHA